MRIERVLTDNGSAYRSRLFAKVCQSLGIKHNFTRPYRPQTNGKAERFIQTCLREWAYARTYANSAERTAWLPAFPRPVHLGPRAIAWRWSDLEQWSAARATDHH